MNINVKPATRAPIVGVINPASLTANTYTTAWVSMATFANVLAIIAVGAMTTNGTLDAKFEQAQDSGGTGAKDIAGKAITQLTQAGTDSNKQVELNVMSEDLDVNNSFTHVRLSVTTATAASLAAAVLLGFNARYQPATDLTTVDEIV